MLEAIVTLATIVQRFDFELACEPGEVGMSTGATIHTKNGLAMRLIPRAGVRESWKGAAEVAREKGSRVALAVGRSGNGSSGGCPVAH